MELNGLFKMAQQIAQNMSNNNELENDNEIDNIGLNDVPFDKLISSVSSNMFKMMNNSSLSDQNINEPLELNNKSSLTELSNKNKTKNLYFDLHVTLEEIYLSKKKKLKVKIKNNDESIVKKLVVNIKPSMKNGDKVYFYEESDQVDGFTSGDIIITIVELPHAYFKRINNDLFIDIHIDICDVYLGEHIINTLDSRTLIISNNKYLKNLSKKIQGEGMPVLNDSIKTFGDLFINFIINISKKIAFEDLQIIYKIFNNKIISDKQSENENKIRINIDSDTESNESSNEYEYEEISELD